jgi:hypothetical protein
MTKIRYNQNSPINEIFDDLEKYLSFCQDYGYKYDESTLYNMESPVFRQYKKFVDGKPCVNRWVEDAKVFIE